MSYAGHIGRVGALAVALGVGVAVATTPGVAYAQPSDSGSTASSPGDSSAASPSSPISSADGASADASAAGAASTGPIGSAGADGADAPSAVPPSVTESGGSAVQTVTGGEGAPVVVISSSGGANTSTGESVPEEIPVTAIPDAADDGDHAPVLEPVVTADEDDVPTAVTPSGGTAHSGGSTAASEVSGSSLSAPDATGNTPTVAAADEPSTANGDQPLSELSPTGVADTPVLYASAAAASATALPEASVETVSPASTPGVWDFAGDLVDAVTSVATQLVSAVVTQLLSTAPSSGDSPLLWAMLGFARREFGLDFLPTAPAASGLQYQLIDQNGQVVATAADPLSLMAADPNQHVLLIGVDGTNLSAILADPYNQAFFDLMNTGTTAASTIVGHTSISDPSWTGVLTGVWSETAGVINNVFTPWTYDTWPTVFNQLETLDPSIATTVIADWAVIAQIAGAGSIPADHIDYISQIGDGWLETDDAVGAASVAAIENTLPGVASFQMTYFVGVDNTGHDGAGAGTPEYANALRNVNDNIADIMTAIDDWEAANPNEEWTVIAVTDHGQMLQPPLGLGVLAHGFQTPIETTTWVIANGPDFEQGAINNTYRNLDVTPTVMELFGFTPEPYSEGESLMDRSSNNYKPSVPGQEALQQALEDAIDMYGYPDITTDVALGIRTIAATVPYFILSQFTSLTEGLPVFIALPVQFIGAVLYQSTNIPAQLIARLTGVTGNDIIPPNLWPYTTIPDDVPSAQTVTLTTLTPLSAQACTDQGILLAACVA